ncbi:MAG TPA: TRAP transporter substrate-binding protein DctP, partial [Planctomycetota bacterium]|nr:TRAP transporter substrate-binding protein DctP [Planctomycetota bacterium]
MRRPLALALALALAFVALLAVDARADDKPALRLGTLAPEGTPWAELLEKFRDHVEEATRGELKVKLSLNGRAGDEPEMLKRIAEKKLTGGGFTTSGLAALAPELEVLEWPFLFENDAEADQVMDGPVREVFAKALEAKGLFLYCWAVNGWVDLGSAKGPLTSIDELRAAHPCARESGIRQAFWKACGATPQVIPVPDVPAALRGGRVDAYDTTPLFAASAQWFKETKHWTVSRHVYQPAAVVFDLAWWSGLPEELRKTLLAFAPELQASARRAVRGIDAGLLDEFRRASIEVHELTPEARAQIAAAILPALLKMSDPAMVALRARIAEELAKLRAARVAAAPKADPFAERLAAADRYAAARPKVSDLNRGEYELQEALKLQPRS